MSLFRRTREEISCRISVENTSASLHAHVELDGDPRLRPGDRVRVHGAPIAARFGERFEVRRDATVLRAGFFERQAVRIASRLLLTELAETSFTSGARL